MATADDRVELDITNLTSGDLQRLDNPVLKAVLLQVKKQMEDEDKSSGEPMQHSSHAVFYSELSPP